MAKQITYKPDYLKLEPKKPMDRRDIIGAMVDLEYFIFPFGSFSDLSLNYGYGEVRWAVLRFDPFSKDVNLGDRYDTREAALKDALVHLEQNGFYATPFDLEGLIDKVEIQR